MVTPAYYPGQTKDYRLQYNYLDEYASFNLPLVDYHPLETEITEIDEIHNEVLESSKTYGDVEVRALFEVQTTEQNLEHKGKDFKDEVHLYIPLPCAVTAGLASVDSDLILSGLTVQSGDRFEYVNHIYEVINALAGSPWGEDRYSRLWIDCTADIKRGDVSSGKVVYNPDNSS